MARRCWRMVLLAFLTHVSLELCGFVGSWTAVKAQPTTVRVHALDPDAAAALGVASSAVSVFDFARKQIAWFAAEFARVPLLPRLSPATTAENHAKELLKLMSARQTIIPQLVELPERLIEGTDFEKLMITVLNDNRTGGLSAVHAEPGVGKSVATAMALRDYTQKSAVTVLLQGNFQKNLRDFFRIEDADDAARVALELFRTLKQRGIRLQMVFDNTFDTGLRGQDQLLMDLTRHAFQYRHHLIVITQSEEAAREAATLNGERTRAVQQEDARTYRWRNTQARDFLTNNPLMDFRQQTVEVVLNMTQIPDTFGGWRPVSIMEYLQTGRRPPAPQAGQGAIGAIARAVWVRQLQQDGNGGFDFVGNAFKITGVVADIDDLKKAIEKEMKLSIAAPLIEIFSQEDGQWSKEDEDASIERGASKSDCYGYLIP